MKFDHLEETTQMKLWPYLMNDYDHDLFVLFTWQHLYSVFIYSHALLIKKDLCQCRNVSIKS